MLTKKPDIIKQEQEVMNIPPGLYGTMTRENNPVKPLQIDGIDNMTDEQKVEALAKKASPEAVQKIYALMGSEAPGIALKAAEAILAYAIGKPVERKQVMIMDRSKLLDECKELAEKMGYDTQHMVIDQ